MGMARNGEVFILRDLPPREIVKTVAHEVKHIAQSGRGTRTWRERDSFSFEYEFMQNMCGATRDDLIVELIKRRY
jgi:hypothetical protein